ncbi:MAG: processing protein, partial [Baekduia sp.]|nr:processing protein [Baekduia sp.]
MSGPRLLPSRPVTTACDACLRRGALIALLAGPIATVLRPERRRDRPAGLLALSNDELIEAVAGDARPRIEQAMRRFRPAAARAKVVAAGCDAVCRHADEYPERLTQLGDRPNPLYLRGGVGRLQRLCAEPSVAVVGGRHPSEYAREVAHEMGRGLGAAGVTVISGLALGIDAASHRGALAGGGAALAVLGCGPDIAYPRRHLRLYEEIVEHGVVVSELEPGTQPFQWSFPARNRIMAALAEVVVVVEAREASGSLITSTFAADLGREVAAVPGQVTARVAAGSNHLLREGATLVRNAEDVLDVLFGVGLGPREPDRPQPELDTPLQIVLNAVEVRESLERAALRAGLSAGGLRAALGRLESLGLVRRDG